MVHVSKLWKSSSICCRYWTRAALVFWPPSCRWWIHRQKGLQHCMDILERLTTEPDQLDSSADPQPQPATSKLPSAAANAAELHPTLQTDTVHARQSAAHSRSRGNQDPYTLANMMWNLFKQQLLCSPSELNTFTQAVKRLNFQSLADQVVDNMRRTVSLQLITFHTEHILLLAPHVTRHMMQTYVTCRG